MIYSTFGASLLFDYSIGKLFLRNGQEKCRDEIVKKIGKAAPERRGEAKQAAQR